MSTQMQEAEHRPPHDDGHRHAHAHLHAPRDFSRAFLIGIVLNLGFVAVEALFGILANSMALLADAGHNLSDVFGLVVAWAAAILAKRPPTPRYTYGLRSSSILAALANAIILLIAVGAIVWEALNRLREPEPVAGTTVLIVASAGIIINAATAWLFMSGRKQDLNVEGAFLHMAADAAVSLGVVVAAAMTILMGWLWLDPVVSLVIAGVIVASVAGVLRDSVALAVHGVPRAIDEAAVRRALAALPGVASIHDLHIWGMSTTETALTCHLVMPGGSPGDEFLAETARLLRDRFGIDHATLQIEQGDGPACALSADHVV